MTVTDPIVAEAAERSALAAVLSRQAAIAEMAQRALSEHDLQQLLDHACLLAARIMEADLVDVVQLSPDGRALTIVAGMGWRPGIVGQLRLPTEGGSQSGYMLATGEPVVVADLATEKRFTVPPILFEHGARSGVSVRIGGAGRPFGALAAFSPRPSAFSRDDAWFLQSMADILGSAVARLLVEGELRRSRDELATIVGNVADGITVQLAEGGLLFANDAAARIVGYPDGPAFLEAPMAEWMSRFELLDEDGQPMPYDRLPGRVALVTGQASPPTLVRFRIRATGEERWSLVQATPVLDGDGPPRQVVNIFRDVSAQRRADLAQRLLTEASAALSSTLDVDEAARRLARLCVPELADYCVVDLLEDDGSVRSAAIAHANADRLALAVRARELRPPDLDAPSGVAAVIREGRSEMLAEVPEELIRASALNEEELALFLALQLRSYICVPLRARGRAVGALSLVHAESGRQFDEDDLRLAEELGARAGVAVENARLYEAVDIRRAELDAVISAMAEAVLVFDERGVLRISNRSAARLFGRNVPSTTADLRRRLQPTGDGVAATSGEPAGTGSVDDLLGNHRLGSRYLEISVYRPAVPGRAPAPTADAFTERRAGTSETPSVVVVRDVTEQRAAQLARDAFMGVLSHELRTPITTIYGGSELLERGLTPDQASDVIRDIRTESERLARLVEDLLVMSRVERGGVEIGDEPVLIQRILPPLVESLTTRWPGLKVEIDMAEELPAVRGDMTYLEQVLRNLLTNAVRYGDAVSRGVVLKVIAEDEGREVIVRVLDRGPGVGSEGTDRLFELFYRAPEARRVPGGAGIGLFVCRQLVEAMGGRIWARPRLDGGAEFGFALPVIETDVVA
jgi:signal transduction histidine kinase